MSAEPYEVHCLGLFTCSCITQGINLEGSRTTSLIISFTLQGLLFLRFNKSDWQDLQVEGICHPNWHKTSFFFFIKQWLNNPKRHLWSIAAVTTLIADLKFCKVPAFVNDEVHLYVRFCAFVCFQNTLSCLPRVSKYSYHLVKVISLSASLTTGPFYWDTDTLGKLH